MAVPRAAPCAFVALLAFLLCSSSSSPASHCPRRKVVCPGHAVADNTCILPGDLFDGIPDCPGVPGRTADEQNCTACASGAFLCQKDSRCIRREWLCDSTDDCSDAEDEDERHCRPNRTVTWHGVELMYYRPYRETDTISCGGGVTRWGLVVCDGVKDCRDGRDEESYTFCSSEPGKENFRLPVCHSGSVKCWWSAYIGDSFRPCLPAKKVCDGWQNCVDDDLVIHETSSDERNCSATSTTTTTTTTTSMASSSITARTPTSTATSPSVASPVPPEDAAPATSSSAAVRS